MAHLAKGIGLLALLASLACIPDRPIGGSPELTLGTSPPPGPPTPEAATQNPDLVEACGQRQDAVVGAARNDNVVGEGVAAQDAVGVTGSFKIHHGFSIPSAH